MRKYVTLVLATLMLGSTPLFAAEKGPEVGQLPKVLTDLGLTQDDLKDIDKGVVDTTPSKSEADIMQRRYRRYCGRGRHLEAFRIRIGRFVIVRYRCVRNHHRWDGDYGDHRRGDHYWDSTQPGSQNMSTPETQE